MSEPVPFDKRNPADNKRPAHPGTPKEPLSVAFVQKVIEEIKSKHRRRYKERMISDPKTGKSTYVRRKTYDCDDLFSDLEFVLNHMHID